jgi:cyclophilin family peptidyl-prolyl cis-trans isomerase
VVKRAAPLLLVLALTACGGGSSGSGTGGTTEQAASTGGCSEATTQTHDRSLPDKHLKLDPAKTYRLFVQTNCGDFTITLDQKTAPNATGSLVSLAQRGFFDDTFFHRIVPRFVIQGGDPTGTGSGGPGYTIQDEVVVGDYERGVVAMARTSAPNSQGSQFFICLTDLRDRLPKSGGYVIFGLVTSGMDVADKIAAGPNSGSPSNQALQPVAMSSVEIVAP